MILMMSSVAYVCDCQMKDLTMKEYWWVTPKTTLKSGCFVGIKGVKNGLRCERKRVAHVCVRAL